MDERHITGEHEPNELTFAGDGGESTVFHAITEARDNKASDLSSASDAMQLPSLVNTVTAANDIDLAHDLDDDSGDDSHTMSVIEHLDELRNRILRSIGYVFVAFVIALFFSQKIFCAF